jgi:DNA-binding protein H-NS
MTTTTQTKTAILTLAELLAIKEKQDAERAAIAAQISAIQKEEKEKAAKARAEEKAAQAAKEQEAAAIAEKEVGEAIAKITEVLAGLSEGSKTKMKREMYALMTATFPKVVKEKKEKKEKVQGAKKVAPKYADGNGNLWTGRGHRPKWLTAALEAGATLESFLIQKTEAAETGAQ